VSKNHGPNPDSVASIAILSSRWGAAAQRNNHQNTDFAGHQLPYLPQKTYLLI
jgi:hypothetical protein